MDWLHPSPSLPLLFPPFSSCHQAINDHLPRATLPPLFPYYPRSPLEVLAMGVASPSSPSPGIDFRSAAALNLARLSERADSTPERWGWRMKNRQTFTGEIKIPPLSPSPSLSLHAHPWSSPPSPLDLWKWDMAVGGRLGQQSTLLLLLLHPLDPPTHWQAVPFFWPPPTISLSVSSSLPTLFRHPLLFV